MGSLRLPQGFGDLLPVQLAKRIAHNLCRVDRLRQASAAELFPGILPVPRLDGPSGVV
jgi:hypothetical protein